jgi:probable F420-dependent oxidoreductase
MTHADPPRVAIGPSGAWCGLDHLSIADAIAFVREAETAGYDAFWTREGFGREPFVLQAVLATSTDRIHLGSSIANIYARDPVTARAAAGSLQEVSNGRFVMGLGVSHQPWVEAIRGSQYGPPVSEMTSYVRAYRAADYRAPQPFGEPPLLIGALRSGMLTVAGELADGAFPYLVPERYVRTARHRLDAGATDRRPFLAVTLPALPVEAADAARQAARAYLKAYLALPNYLANLREHGYDESDLTPPGSDRLVDELVAWGGPAEIRAKARRLHEAGADHVAIIPLFPDGRIGALETLLALAPPW